MARFDVYRDSDGNYLLNVQADLLDHLNTCVVVPLMRPRNAPRPAQHLNPTFRLGRTDLVMVTQFMAAVPRNVLKQKIGTLAAHHTEIVRALDMLMQGF
jgi:toxin CcdB